jgi:hypothetical protein
MKRMIPLLLLCALPLAAQRSDTILRNLFNNRTTVGNTAEINNIGQSQHRAIVTLTNAPSQTCSANSNIDMVFMASFDANTWFEIGTPLTAMTRDGRGNLIATVEADGAFPHLRFTVYIFDTVHCLLRVDYSGTLYPNPASAAVAPYYNTRGLQRVAFAQAITAGNSATIVVNTSPATRRLTIYGMYVAVDSSTTLSIPAINGSFVQIPMAANEKINIPAGGVAQLVLPVGQDLSIKSSNNVNVYGWFVYRLEDDP